MSPPEPGSPMETMPDAFEQHARVLLEDSVTRIDGRIRSRLNQARHAAVEEAARSRGTSFIRRLTVMPAAGAVAAAVMVAFVLWPHSRQPVLDQVAADGGRHTSASVEDLDLLADGDALDLVSDETDGGAFYEWAVEQQQADSNETSS